MKPHPPLSCLPRLFLHLSWDHLEATFTQGSGSPGWPWPSPQVGRVASVHLHTQVSSLQCLFYL